MASSESCPVVEQAVGWALHALEPDEEISVAAHIPGCTICQAAVHDTEEVVAGLGLASDQVQAPPALRASLMAAVAETPQVPMHPTHDHQAPAPEPPPPADPSRRVDPRRPASWMSRRVLVLAAMALVAAVAVGGLAVRTAQLDRARVENSQAMSDVLNELIPSGTRHAVLTTPDGATVGAVVLVDGQRQVLTVGMPVNPADHTYVLWGVAGQSAPVALGTFEVNAPDVQRVTVGSEAAEDRFSTYAVSLEPGHTAPAEPSTVMAKGRVV
ncbi:MAG: anti-sigma factor [Pseudonocardia sp.]|nr:anti-sigma factor [Pseudonocardia sp.]